MQLEIEEAALKKETDNLSQERLADTAERAGRDCVTLSTVRKLSGTMRNIP